MLYEDFLKNVDKCPFCSGKNRIIDENESAFITYSIAPYHKHHLLVIPKRHVVDFLELNDKEDSDISDLIDKSANILKKLGYEDYSILVRNGKGGDNGKSVDHIHYHAIPNIHIGNLKHGGGDRLVMSEDEIDEIMYEIKSVM